MKLKCPNFPQHKLWDTVHFPFFLFYVHKAVDFDNFGNYGVWDGSEVLKFWCLGVSLCEAIFPERVYHSGETDVF